MGKQKGTLWGLLLTFNARCASRDQPFCAQALQMAHARMPRRLTQRH
jgi:hypothetical protein